MYIPTDEYLDEIKARTQAATPGPWESYGVLKDSLHRSVAPEICNLDDGEYVENPNADADAKFIAAARSDVPNLECGCRNLKGKVAALEADLAAARAERDAAREALEKLSNRVDLFVKGARTYTQHYICEEGDEMTVGVAMNLIGTWADELSKENDITRALIEKALKGEPK